MSIRNEIRKAGFPTELVSFRNTPQGTVASFPCMGQSHGWREDVPVRDIIPTMEWDASFVQSEDWEEEEEEIVALSDESAKLKAAMMAELASLGLR